MKFSGKIAKGNFFRPACLGTLAATLGVFLLTSPTRADCVLDVYPRPEPAFSAYTTVFPNWATIPISSFSILLCDDSSCPTCPSGPITGITLVNYGTATGGTGGDVANLYCWLSCGSKTYNSGMLAMTWAGTWDVGGTPYPAWTWAGSKGGVEVCTNCGCELALYVYADINDCPTDGATIQLAPNSNSILNPTWPGGIYDSCGCSAPWSSVPDPMARTIRYVFKQADADSVSPGDTVNYTVYYGRPGTGSIGPIVIIDTQPSYTHLLAGSASPAPDPFWDPNPGPPLRLRWTFPGPFTTAGGPTGRINFSLTVDWGNGDSFEPGSGNVAAPEGTFLFNSAHMSWTGGGCASGRVSNIHAAAVRRYLFWKVADNDLLFAPRLGQPDDEITYELFVKNMSDSKTWWDVRIWDTVPSDLDAWSFGFDDACAGWTMTPTGCAAASPGWVPSAPGTTLLTWKLDMPPGMTMTLRWKAKVKPSAQMNTTAINRASLMALGRTRIVGGTGHAGIPKNFTHEAPILLRTTYTSYVGIEATDLGTYGCTKGQTWFLTFYPLNKATNFSLYRKWCGPSAPADPGCAAFAANGGVSPAINVMAGTCTGGPGTDWEMGCKAERAPARFIPSQFSANQNPAVPFNYLHKLVSNSPLIWELSVCFEGGHSNTYSGTTNLTFAGYAVYTYSMVDSYPQLVNNLYIVNTSDTAPTTVHMFDWNPTSLSWDYLTTSELYTGSQWAYVPAVQNHYRIISSDARIIVHKCYPGGGATGDEGNLGTMVPNRENGNLVNSTTPATFYLWAGHLPAANAVIVGNVGAANATYDVYRYTPFDTTLTPPSTSVTSDLVGNAGYWVDMGSDTVQAGLAAAGNGHVYGTAYDPGRFTVRYRLYKIRLTSGGPIQICTGRYLMQAQSGGSMIHSSDPAGAQMGREFWLHTSAEEEVCGAGAVSAINIFCPKMTMVVNETTSDGAAATYTTGAADQCVAFMRLTNPASGSKRNYRINVLAGGNPGDAIAQYFCCYIGSKYYTAPFLALGVFYNIIAPPVVFLGQSFWITVVVMDTGGGTRTSYNGTTSFTSTDPGGKIESANMDSYDYGWTGCPGTCGVKIFFNVSMTQLGLQTIMAQDTIDGSIMGLTAIMVVAADVKLEKRKKLTVAASGDTVQFQICWSNFSSATAFSFTITDAVPMGTTYVPEVASTMLCGASAPVPGITVWYSTATTTVPPGTFTSVPGTGSPLGNTRWLRWTIRDVYVNSTGCVCFKVSVN